MRGRWAAAPLPARGPVSWSAKSIASAQPTIGWMPAAGHLLGEFERAEHIVGVGQRQRRLPVGFGELGQSRDRQRALEQRIRRMDVQVYEAGFGHGPSRFSGADSPCASNVRAAAGAVHRRRGLRAIPPAYPQPVTAGRGPPPPAFGPRREPHRVGVVRAPQSLGPKSRSCREQGKRGEGGGFLNDGADH